MESGLFTMAASIKQKVGTRNQIETYHAQTLLVPKSADEDILIGGETFSDERQDDDVYDDSMLPDDWTQEIEDEYDAEYEGPYDDD